MPRDGLSQYAPPPGTNGITNYTIESTKYNGFVADVTQDLNLPRPIVAGGTGANNAHDALINLHGEEANQTVTNYDSFPFVPGSFWSAAGATAAPNGNVFTGICYQYGNSADWLVLEAREVLAPGSGVGRLFVRQKLGGTWTAWALQAGSTADLEAAYVNVAGDTMTGGLTAPYFRLPTADGPATPLTITGGYSGARMMIYGGSDGLQINNLANTKVVFQINDSGDINVPSGTLGVTGAVSASGPVLAGAYVGTPGHVHVGDAGPSGIIYFGSTATKYLQFDGSTFNLGGATLNVPSGINSGGAIQAASVGIFTPAGLGSVVVGGNGGAGHCTEIYSSTTQTYIQSYNRTGSFWTQMNLNASTVSCNCPLAAAGLVSSSNIVAQAGPVTASAHLMTQNGIVYFNPPATAYINFAGDWGCTGGVNFTFNQNVLAAGHVGTSLGYLCQAGVSGTRSGNRFNIEYVTTPHLWINGTDLGQFQMVSDYRVKKDVIDLPGMWDTVKALRPIKFTQAEFTPPAEIKLRAEEAAARKAKADKGEPYSDDGVPTGPMFAADDIERWGFIAHELQDTLVPSAAHGVKDDPVAVQAPNAFTVIAALTKALQEAMTRIEALEAAP